MSDQSGCVRELLKERNGCGAGLAECEWPQEDDGLRKSPHGGFGKDIMSLVDEDHDGGTPPASGWDLEGNRLAKGLVWFARHFAWPLPQELMEMSNGN